MKQSTWNDPALWRAAAAESFRKLDPREQARNPVMFIVWLVTVPVTILLFWRFSAFNAQIAAWLWATLLFANLAESLAEGRGKAQAASLRAMRTHTMARKLDGGREIAIAATELMQHDLVVCEAGDLIPADGEVIEGIATVDESAITGESAPVIRESGGDRCAVTGGTRVLSDRIVIKVTAAQGEGFLDRMISLIEGAKRQKTPNERALGAVLVGLTVVFVLVVLTLPPLAWYSEEASGNPGAANITLTTLAALFVCLIPTTIGGLLSAIGIGGMDRLMRKNVLAMSGRAVAAAGDVDVLLLDKTGTITLGNRMATAFLPAPGTQERELAEAAQWASLADETPEGRSIVVLAKEIFQLRARDVGTSEGHFVPFTAETRMSGVDLPIPGNAMRRIRKGAVAAVRQFVEAAGGTMPAEALAGAEHISRMGGTPLAVAENNRVLGIVHLKDVVKGGIRERFAQLRKMGIRTVMITGDNPLTAAAIAAEAGVDDFIAEARPEDKLARIRQEQAEGRLVAMIGDGTNDAPALAYADVGVAMHTGTQAAREAGNMIDLDSNPTKLLEIVETGKQILMTRGSLTTFSFANDVSKYFAILPAMFGGLYAIDGRPGQLSSLNIMGLATPESAILAAIIFNALVIVALIPLALRGVKYEPIGAEGILRRNLLVYGLGGLVAPFIGIKLIDLILAGTGAA
ncbi:MAG: potassium-transporting ATPase subunit KdpB [Candidatus Hydrogenedentota bacterium]